MKKLITLIAMLAIAGIATADLIPDGDFAAGTISQKDYVGNFGTLDDGWYQNNNAVTWDVSGNDLTRIASVESGGLRGAAQIWTTRAADLGTSLKLQFDYSIANAGADADFEVVLYSYTRISGTGFGSADRLYLYQNTLPAGDQFTIAELGRFELTDTAASSAIGQLTGSFDTTGIDHLAVRIIANDFASTAAITVDNISIVPEPATVGMLGLGALVALLIRRIRA